jgi:hypothetical protein
MAAVRIGYYRSGMLRHYSAAVHAVHLAQSALLAVTRTERFPGEQAHQLHV